MKNLKTLFLAIIICSASLAQKKVDTAKKEVDSVWAEPKMYVLKFTPNQIKVFNAILSNQDFSRKLFSEFLEEYNRQINAQIVKVPAKK